MSATELANLEEQQLIGLAKSGNDIALAELDLRYRDALVGFARRSVGSDADADDVAQNTLAQALTALDQFELGTNFRAWLFRIARNSIIDWSRKSSRYQARLADKQAMVIARGSTVRAAPIDSADSMTDGASPDQNDGNGIFAYAQRVLKPREYQALWWQYVDQLAIDEIARRMERSPGAVRVLLTRARKRLKSFRTE